MTLEDQALGVAMQCFVGGYERDHCKAIVLKALKEAVKEEREAWVNMSLKKGDK